MATGSSFRLIFCHFLYPEDRSYTPLTQVHKYNPPNPHLKQSRAGLPFLHQESRSLRIFALGAEKKHSAHKPQLYIEIVPSREFPPSRESDLITCLWMCLKQQNSTERHQEGRKMECLSCPTKNSLRWTNMYRGFCIKHYRAIMICKDQPYKADISSFYWRRKQLWSLIFRSIRLGC